ncbi:MAG: transcriptional regulator, TetR family [Acidobacteriales bacterium]|nr:transcriptional regulator, TetR family [Terriglobales bacterium]
MSDGSEKRGRGRPRGLSAKGDSTRKNLYEVAVSEFAEHGYEATTLRDIAHRAGVSVGLLYRYFPGKRSVVLALYDDLSAEYARRAEKMKAGKWRDRFIFALTTSLEVLGRHRTILSSLIPVLVGNDENGIFAPEVAFSRLRVLGVFQTAVKGASDAPRQAVADALARLLYLVHLAIILWWLLDRSPRQRATTSLLGLLKQGIPAAAMALRIPKVSSFVIAGDKLFREALFGEGTPA